MFRYSIVLLILPLMGFTFLDPVAKKNEQGNRLFEAGKFQEALEYYQKAQVEDPDAPQLRFNAGDAYYKQDAYQEALQEFGRALKSKDPALLGQAYYNVGNVYFRQQKLQEAVEAYKRSLALQPDDLDSKINLELALEKLQEQKEQDKNQDKQDQNQDKQDQDQQQDQSQQQDQDQKDQNQDRQEDQEDQNKNKQDQNQDQKEQNQEQQQQDQDQDQQQDQQSSEAQSEAGELSREEAERLLDALKGREAEAQKYRRFRIRAKPYKGNEW